MLANPVRRTMCASPAMMPGQVAQASTVAKHTECEHVGTPYIVLFQSAVAAQFGGHPGQLDTLGTSRGKDIPSACQGAIVIRFEFWS